MTAWTSVAIWITGWAGIYDNSAALRTLLGFAHVGGLVVAAGWAMTADWSTLFASRSERARRDALDRMRASHRCVLWGLAVVFASGLLLFAADVDTYATSRIFWSKMAAIALLAANGARLQRFARRALDHPDRWAGVRRAALFSIALWSAITLLGSALPNVG